MTTGLRLARARVHRRGVAGRAGTENDQGVVLYIGHVVIS